jgi:hypothetical protein
MDIWVVLTFELFRRKEKEERGKGKGERRKEKGERRKGGKGERRKEKGEWRKGKGERRKEKGERRKGKGERRKEKGERDGTKKSSHRKLMYPLILFLYQEKERRKGGRKREEGGGRREKGEGRRKEGGGGRRRQTLGRLQQSIQNGIVDDIGAQQLHQKKFAHETYVPAHPLSVPEIFFFFIVGPRGRVTRNYAGSQKKIFPECILLF